jgi:DNA-binding transcriptional ArsR family regulator
MSSLSLEDPRALRALASPVRLALIEWLREHGPATATRCAGAVGVSVQLCSYHLRALAKWGFVGEVQSDDGRERPWELVARTIDVPKGRLDKPELLSAWNLLRARLIDRHIEVVNEFAEREASYPPEWREAATFLTNPVYVSPDELEQLADRLSEVVRPFMHRDRSECPPNAEPAYVVVWAIPRPETP